MKPQTIENLKGEIEFRKKLARQHVTGEMLLPDYFDKAEHDKILDGRVRTTLRDVKRIEKLGRVSPFIELGAERCQRSLVLTNDFKARGFAVDISYHQLRTAGHFAEVFNRPKLPIRVCCDVNNLPFRDHSFPFVFCYEFIHHFPSPAPIVGEIHRIMSSGTFLFSEEPFKRPRAVFYRQRSKAYSKSTLRGNDIIRFIELFLSEEYCDEREHGILENDDISLREWIEAMSIFDEKKLRISSLRGRIGSELGGRIRIRNLLNMLLGGRIRGVCTKESTETVGELLNLTKLFLCPECIAKPEYIETTRPPLTKTASGFACPVCQSSFPVIDDITFLLPKTLFRQLYPEFAG